MNTNGSVGVVQTKYFSFAEPPDEVILESERTLGPVTLAYETYGTLNRDKSNAILVLTPSPAMRMPRAFTRETLPPAGGMR